jgi:hypothetical protein
MNIWQKLALLLVIIALFFEDVMTKKAAKKPVKKPTKKQSSKKSKKDEDSE